MIVQLTPSWQLEDERDGNYYPVPYLVNRQSGEAYGASTIVQCYPSWPPQPASHAVRRMTLKPGRFSDEEKAFIGRFIGGGAS